MEIPSPIVISEMQALPTISSIEKIIAEMENAERELTTGVDSPAFNSSKIEGTSRLSVDTVSIT